MFKSKKDTDEKEMKQEESEELNKVNEDLLQAKAGTDKEDDSKEQSAAELQGQIKILKDTLLRKAAEFENYKRRSETDMASFYQYASENIIKDLLPILDDFERINQAWNEKKDAEVLAKGLELLYDKFKKVLDKQGVKELEAKGKEFDVNIHDALMMQPINDSEPNTVIDVAEKGYMLKDKVIRHAKVIVAVKPDSDNESQEVNN